MRNATVTRIGGTAVVLMDSISLIGPHNAGDIIVCGSHGGRISAAFAAKHPPALVVFNDAGGGKGGAGRAAVALLADAGIACATVGHETARIGDSDDSFRAGVISAANRLAEQRGVSVGTAVADAIAAFAGSASGPPDG